VSFPSCPAALYYLKFAYEPINSIVCYYLTLFFHLAYAYRTQESWIPSPLLTIYTKNAKNTTHRAG
jgi:hypothetical protein